MKHAPPRSPFFELVLSRLREFFREPEAIFWVYVFPVFLAIGLGIAFRSSAEPELRVGVTASGDTAVAEVLSLEAAGLQAVRTDAESGRGDLAAGRLDLLVLHAGDAPPGDGTSLEYVYDPSRTEGLLARERADAALQKGAGRRDPLVVTERPVSAPGTRYIDFLFPGLIGMNIMGGGLYGVGFVIVDMRVRKLLKRFLATPMRKRDFFLSILTSRLVFLAPEMLFLLSIAHFAFGMPLRGSVASLVIIILVASLSFCGLGLLLATRARKIETISGLMNLAMLPMWLLSGIFFSTDRFPEYLQPFIQALPLTATINALRAVALEGAGLASQLGSLAIVLAWGGIGYLLSLKLFRWL